MITLNYITHLYKILFAKVFLPSILSKFLSKVETLTCSRIVGFLPLGKKDSGMHAD